LRFQKYAFIPAHREEFGIRAMCRVLRVHFSGFYGWLKKPLSHRAQEDARQTELIRQAWADSGKVCGYRKLTDDLRDQSEQISENRVARLASLAGIAAQVGCSTTRSASTRTTACCRPLTSKLDSRN
jgi:putative transposase